MKGGTKTFLSTPSARRATNLFQHQQQALDISIHALREEGDKLLVGALAVLFLFLSTPSARRATKEIPLTYDAFCISIHALREEGDGSPS